MCMQAYEHASQLVAAFADVPMGVEVLVQIDRLVQLLETPVFTFLRLQLLQPARYPALIRCAVHAPLPAVDPFPHACEVWSQPTPRHMSGASKRRFTPRSIHFPDSPVGACPMTYLALSLAGRLA